MRVFVNMIILLCLCVGQRYGIAQDGPVVLEDDIYNCSLLPTATMTMQSDSINDGMAPYIVYSGTTINEKDTMYYRLDLWENPSADSSMDFAQSMLDSTLIMVGERLGGTLLYDERIERNGWPARLARYEFDHLRRRAKVLLVWRNNRYYLLTVLCAPNSFHHDDVNRFLHSLQVY